MNAILESSTAVSPDRSHKEKYLYALAVLLLFVTAAARIIPTYGIFTEIFDEPFHIANGMSWLDKGAHSAYEHPPLASAILALAPYLAGLRSPSVRGKVSTEDEGNAILYTGNRYWHNLKLARVGNLLFLFLACVMTYLWACRWYSRPVGVIAVFLFVNLPPILGHAGLATLDIACVATIMAALYQFMRWLETPIPRRAVALGLACGLAFLCKFSCIVFLPTCFIVSVVYLHFCRPSALIAFGKPRLIQASMAIAAALILIWFGYHFNLTRWVPSGMQKLEISPISDTGYSDIANATMGFPVPVVQVLHLLGHNKGGHGSYLLGEYRTKGWWYFFPVVLAVKTPLGFLVLAIAGAVVTLWRMRDGPWQHTLTALFAIAILAVCMPVAINLGVRHILSLYPLMSLLAAYAVWLCFQNRAWMKFAIVPSLLAGSLVADSVKAHPDYLAYFNQIAGNYPEDILCESDLDWGQDLNRLTRRLEALGVDEVAIRYFGTAPLDKAGLPRYTIASPNQPSRGYVAVSVRFLRMDNAKDGSFRWLRAYTPLERVGKSIYLYDVPN